MIRLRKFIGFATIFSLIALSAVVGALAGDLDSLNAIKAYFEKITPSNSNFVFKQLTFHINRNSSTPEQYFLWNSKDQMQELTPLGVLWYKAFVDEGWLNQSQSGDSITFSTTEKLVQHMASYGLNRAAAPQFVTVTKRSFRIDTMVELKNPYGSKLFVVDGLSSRKDTPENLALTARRELLLPKPPENVCRGMPASESTMARYLVRVLRDQADYKAYPELIDSQINASLPMCSNNVAKVEQITATYGSIDQLLSEFSGDKVAAITKYSSSQKIWFVPVYLGLENGVAVANFEKLTDVPRQLSGSEILKRPNDFGWWGGQNRDKIRFACYFRSGKFPDGFHQANQPVEVTAKLTDYDGNFKFECE